MVEVLGIEPSGPKQQIYSLPLRRTGLRLLGAVILAAAAPAFAQVPVNPLLETRICGEPLRDPDGSIHRSSRVLSAFKRIHPCPATGLTMGACPGWNIDHVIPLASHGCDAVSNLQWLPVEIKRCPGEVCKDRWERRVYAP